MADAGTTPAVKNTVELEADVNVEFNEAASRQQINSGESVKTLFGKLRKFLTDLKAVAFSGAYSDLSGTPDLSRYASKSKYGDTTINVGRKADTTVGEYSTAEGSGTTASGRYSHAEGYLTTAVGNCSHAEGNDTTASGEASHAGGISSIASGVSSFAHGSFVQALHNFEAAFGKNNVSNDDTLFSVGDGTINARHNAFEITKTGGKLHDKDIATTNDIPDLSAYAKTADVPNIKVNSAVDADTVGEKSADDFPQIIDFGWNETDTKIAVGKSGKTAIYKCANWTDFPVGGTNGQGTLIAINFVGEGTAGIDSMWLVQLYIASVNGIIYKRYVSHTTLNGWVEMYSGDDKPYVTGNATVAANSDVCVTNHGFLPSAVIWWSGNDSGVAVSFSDTQFTIDKTSSVGRTINYLIFK